MELESSLELGSVLGVLIVLLGLYLLTSGYSKVIKNEVGGDKYNQGKGRLRGGIGIFIFIGIALIIGFSTCLSFI